MNHHRRRARYAASNSLAATSKPLKSNGQRVVPWGLAYTDVEHPSRPAEIAFLDRSHPTRAERTALRRARGSLGRPVEWLTTTGNHWWQNTQET
jgi:hypothetical protein